MSAFHLAWILCVAFSGEWSYFRPHSLWLCLSLGKSSRQSPAGRCLLRRLPMWPVTGHALHHTIVSSQSSVISTRFRHTPVNTESSPIGLSICILRDVESNKCCTKIAGWDYFSKSRNCSLRLLLHKVFLKLRCENEIKQTPSSRYIYWKLAAEVYPFERCHYSPSRP